MAAALRAAGLVTRLRAEDAAEVAAPPYSPVLDPRRRVRNADAIRDYSHALAARLGELLDAGRFPLVVGGDCSILLGTMLGLRRQERYGLVFVDGHTDFGLPETSLTGGVAGMDLALVTGRGLETLRNLDGLGPLVRDEDVVVLGHRDVNDPERYWGRASSTRPSSAGSYRRSAAPVSARRRPRPWRPSPAAASTDSGFTWTSTCSIAS
jgi:arginase